MGSPLVYLTALGFAIGCRCSPCSTRTDNHLEQQQSGSSAASTLFNQRAPRAARAGHDLDGRHGSTQFGTSRCGVAGDKPPWVRRYNGAANNEDQAFSVVVDKAEILSSRVFSCDRCSGVIISAIKTHAGRHRAVDKRRWAGARGPTKIDIRGRWMVHPEYTLRNFRNQHVTIQV